MSVKTSDNIDSSIFKKNDIRGIAEKSLSPDLYTNLGKAYAKFILDKKINARNSINNIWVSVGWDARLTSPEFAESLIRGLNLSGVNVVCLGLCPTPLAYFSEFADIQKQEILEISG